MHEFKNIFPPKQTYLLITFLLTFKSYFLCNSLYFLHYTSQFRKKWKMNVWCLWHIYGRQGFSMKKACGGPSAASKMGP